MIYKDDQRGKTILIISYIITAASGLNEEQASIQSLASDFAKKEMQPFMSKWDQEVCFFKVFLLILEKYSKICVRIS